MSLIDIDPGLRELVEEGKKIEGPLTKVACSLIEESRLYTRLKLDGDLTSGNNFLLGVTEDLSSIVQANIHKELGGLNWKDVRIGEAVRGLDKITCRYDDIQKKLGLFSAVGRKMLDLYEISGNSFAITMRNVLTQGIRICEFDSRQNGSQHKEDTIYAKAFTGNMASISSTRVTPKRIPR